MMQFREERTRRLFLRDLGLLAGGAAAASGLPALSAGDEAADLVVASGDDAKAIVKKAVAELGGMKKFVSKGDVVVVKPNIAWIRKPETASNTNPDVIAGLIEMALDAGAKEVKVFDRTDRPPKDCYDSSGIGEAARKLGATILYQNEMKTVKIPLPQGVHIKEAVVARDAMECDCFINVPVAKHHGSTKLSIAMKNHMGVVFEGTHRIWHANLNQAIPDFALHFKPKLTVVDAYRILFRGGPAGGNLNDVQTPQKCIVGVDQAAADAYSTTLFPMWAKQPTDIIHIALAGKMGVGQIDLAKLRIREVKA